MDLDADMQAKMHARFAELCWELMHSEPCGTCKRSYPGAKEMTVVRQFLADNGTTADLRNAATLHQLADSLPSFDEEEKVTKPGKAKKRTA